MFANLKATLSLCALTCATIAGVSLTSVTANADEQITIKMWGLVEEGSPEFFDFAKAEFQKTHPNVKIVNEFFPNEAYKTNIQVALVGSEPPDVFFDWSGENAQRLIRDGLALDITDLGAKKDGFKSEISEAWQASFENNGRNYGVPVEAVSKFFFYSKPFFAKHNLTPPKDFGGLLGLCKAIRKIDPTMVPMPLGNSERWKAIHFMTMLNDRVLGSATTAADYNLSNANDKLFTNPGYVEAWQKLLDLQDAGCFQDAPNATSPEVSRSMFSSEVSPMIYCGTWCLSIFDKDGFTDYGLFRMPAIEGGKGNPGSNFLVPQGYMVSAKTKHPDIAVEWLSFLVSSPVAAKFAEIRRAIPSNPKDIDTVSNATEQFKWVVKDVASFAEGINVLDVNLEKSVSEAYLNAGVEVLNHKLTPEEAMEKIRTAALEAKAKKAK